MNIMSQPSGTRDPSEYDVAIDHLRRAIRRWRCVSALLCGMFAVLLIACMGVLQAAPQQAPGTAPKLDDAQAQANVEVEDNDLTATYSNFCRVSGTPEEVILEFGLNPKPFNPGQQHVRVGQKLVLSFFTAKRLAAALVLTIQRHEKSYGPIELDVRKRLQSSKTHDNETD